MAFWLRCECLFILEFLTLVHHLILPLNLLIATMRKKRGISMSNVYARLSMVTFVPPLVFTTTGGMGDTTSIVYKRLANLFCDKLDFIVRHL